MLAVAAVATEAPSDIMDEYWLEVAWSRHSAGNRLNCPGRKLLYPYPTQIHFTAVLSKSTRKQVGTAQLFICRCSHSANADQPLCPRGIHSRTGGSRNETGGHLNLFQRKSCTEQQSYAAKNLLADSILQGEVPPAGGTGRVKVKYTKSCGAHLNMGSSNVGFD